jgi:tetratricopeptide (TPR) repeat protein
MSRRDSGLPPQPDDPLARIAYLAIDKLQARQIGSFQLDSAVPLPIELPPEQRALRPEDISWQAIISAMLKLLAYRPEAAEADYYRRFILAAQPDIKEEFTRAGILKAERGELDLALEIFRSMAGLFPDCGQTRNNLALVYDQQAAGLEAAGEADRAGMLREQAFAAYKAALAAEPELAACHLNFAHFYLRGGNPGKAREHLGLFLKHNTDPERVEQARTLSHRLEGYEQVERTCAQAFDAIQLGREAEGLELLEPVTREHPELWNAWFLTGWARRRLGDYRQAREAFETSLGLNPANPDGLNELAICLLELGEPAEARRRLQEASRLDPGNPKILSNLGVATLRAGDRIEARRLFRTVLRIAPDDPIARGFLEKEN